MRRTTKARPKHGSHLTPGASIVLAVLVTAVPATAEIGVWEPTGPRSGGVQGYAADPTDPHRLYAMQQGAVLRSTDGGRSWRATLETAAHRRSVGLAVAPSAPLVVYAIIGDGIAYRSPDGGATWDPRARPPLDTGAEHLVQCLAIDPADADRVLVGGASGIVARTTDGGATWERTVLPDASSTSAVRALAFDPVDTDTVYATASGRSYRSRDGGASWERIGTDGGTRVSDLAAHVTEPGVLFAATSRGVETSTDGGATWRRLGGPDGPSNAQSVAVDPTDADRLWATADGSVATSADGGETWSRSAHPLTVGVGTIQVPASRPSAVFVRSGAGLVASFDGGSSWELRTPRTSRFSTEGPFALLAPTRGPLRLFAGTREGLFVSSDRAETWSFVPGTGATFVRDLEADRAPRPRLFAATDRGLQASDDGGETWSTISPEPETVTIVAAEARPGVLDLWSDTLGILRSTDGGATWTEGVQPVNTCYHEMEPHPERTGTVVASGDCCFVGEGEPCGGTFLTEDGWATREQLPFLAVDVAIRAPETLFAITGDGIHRSTDLGETWELVTGGLDLWGGDALLVDPSDPEVIFAGVTPDPDAGPDGPRLIVSEDGGDSWVRLDAGLPDDVITDLAIDPRRPEFVYAATRESGLYRLQRRELPEPPAPPAGAWLESEAIPGFRVKARITAHSGARQPVRKEPACIPETLCVSGAVPGRPELFVRIVGPKPNGHLWPTLVKLSTSTIEVWIEQKVTGILRYYRLQGASPESDELPGLFDRTGFLP